MPDVNRSTARAVASHETADRAAGWLCLAAAPTFAAMAVLAHLAEAGHPDMLCSAAEPLPWLSGMTPMYMLMSIFHATPWVNRILGRRTTACRV